MNRCRFDYVWLLLLALLVPAFLNAEEPVVPESVQYALLCKALTFDRNLAARCGSDVVIAILYQRRFRDSDNTRQDFRSAAKGSGFDRVAGLPLRVISVNIEGDDQWQEKVDKQQADVLYVAPLRAVSIDMITGFSRQHHVMTMSGVDDYVEQGVSMAVTSEDGHPKLVVNLKAAKAEGADFSAQLLRLARVLQ